MRTRGPVTLPSCLALALASALACGDDGVSVSAGATEATATSTSPTATETATATATATSDATTTTGPETTTTTTGDSTTDVTATATTTSTSSTTGDSSTGGDATTGEEEGIYAARYFAGGLDRVMLRKAQPMSDLCTAIVLVWPGDGLSNQYDPITRPEGWGIEGAWIAEGAATCLDWEWPEPPQVASSAGAGAVTWMSDEPWMCPPTLDVEVTLDFIPGDLPWVPLKEHLSAIDLPVDGCL